MAATFIPTGSMAPRSRAPTELEAALMAELVRLAERRATEDKSMEMMTSVEFAAIARLFSKKGLKLTPEEVRTVFRMAQKRRDAEKTNGLNRPKIPCIVVDCEEEIKQKAKAAMSVYDRNKDGKVSKKEMEQVSGLRLSKSVIDQAFAAHDADGDGLLDLKELEALMRSASIEEANAKRSRMEGNKIRQRTKTK